jgi:hypothetical protein
LHAVPCTRGTRIVSVRPVGSAHFEACLIAPPGPPELRRLRIAAFDGRVVPASLHLVTCFEAENIVYGVFEERAVVEPAAAAA